MARTSWSTSTARSCSERLPHPPRSVRLASRRWLPARQCSRVGDFRHFVTAITGGGWVLCEVKALSHGTKGQSNGYHRFGYYRRDRIRRLVGLYGYAVEAWEGGCACGVGSDLTACDYVALASRRNTGRILTERYRGFRATYNSPSRAPPLRPACEPATASARQRADAAPSVICTYGGAGCRVSGTLLPPCNARFEPQDANRLWHIGSHIWSTI